MDDLRNTGKRCCLENNLAREAEAPSDLIFRGKKIEEESSLMDQAVARNLYFRISKILLMSSYNKVELVHLVMSFFLVYLTTGPHSHGLL